MRFKYDPRRGGERRAVTARTESRSCGTLKGSTANVTAALRDPGDRRANVTGDSGGAADTRSTTSARPPRTPRNGQPRRTEATQVPLVIVAANVPTHANGRRVQPVPRPAAGSSLPSAWTAAPAACVSQSPLQTPVDAADKLDPVPKNNVVVLRRLANPYLPPDRPTRTSQSIFMDNVSAFDADLRRRTRRPPTAREEPRRRPDRVRSGRCPGVATRPTVARTGQGPALRRELVQPCTDGHLRHLPAHRCSTSPRSADVPLPRRSTHTLGRDKQQWTLRPRPRRTSLLSRRRPPWRPACLRWVLKP